MIKKLFKKKEKPDKKIELEPEKVFEPKPVVPDIIPNNSSYSIFPNMNYEKYGFIGRGIIPYYFIYQDLHFIGTGKIICRCYKIKELNFEVLCTDKLDLTCHKSNDNYTTTFYMNGNIIHSTRYDPEELLVYYDKLLNCEKSPYLFVDK